MAAEFSIAKEAIKYFSPLCIQLALDINTHNLCLFYVNVVQARLHAGVFLGRGRLCSLLSIYFAMISFLITYYGIVNVIYNM